MGGCVSRLGDAREDAPADASVVVACGDKRRSSKARTDGAQLSGGQLGAHAGVVAVAPEQVGSP